MCCFNDIRNATTQESLFSKLVYVNAWGWGRLNLCLSAACEMKTNSLGGSRMRSLFSRCLQWASLRHNSSLPPQWVGFPSRDMSGIPAGIPTCHKSPKVSQFCCHHWAVISASEDGYFSSEKIFNLDFWGEKNVILTGNPTPEIKDLIQRKWQKLWGLSKRKGCVDVVRLASCSAFHVYFFLAGSDKVWVKEGYCDPNNMPRALLKHEKSTNLQIK